MIQNTVNHGVFVSQLLKVKDIIGKSKINASDCGIWLWVKKKTPLLALGKKE